MPVEKALIFSLKGMYILAQGNTLGKGLNKIMARKLDLVLLMMLSICLATSVSGQDIVRVYHEQRLICEIPVEYQEKQELPSEISYNFVLYRMAIQSSIASISPGDVYGDIKVSLGTASSFDVNKSERNPGIGYAYVGGQVKTQPYISHQRILIKAFRNLRSEKDALPNMHGHFSMNLENVPGNYSFAAYVAAQHESAALQAGQEFSFAGISFVGALSKTIVLNFNNISLEFVLQELSQEIGITFIVDDTIKQKALSSMVTIINARPVTIEQTFEILQSVLVLKEIGLVQQGKVWKILPLEQLARNSHKVETGQNIPEILHSTKDNDLIMTQIIPLRFGQAVKIRVALEPLLSEKSGRISHEDNGNRLIITDYASNIKKLTQIVAALDVPVAKEIPKIYFLRYINVQKVERIIKPMLEGTQGTVRFVAEPQSKALVILAQENIHERVETILKTLDLPDISQEIIVAHPVRYANVEKLADTLTKLFGSASGEQGSAGVFYGDTFTSNLIISTSKNLYEQKILPLLNKLDTVSGERTRSFVYRLSHANADKMSEQLGKIFSKSAGTDAGKNKAAIGFASHTSTNSLIITCSNNEYEDIVETIKQLDIETKQVFLEVVIVEVSITDRYSIGAEWSYRNSDHFGSQGTVGTFDSDFGLGRLKNNNELPGGRYAVVDDKVSALVNLLATTSEINVLSAPKIYTANNEEAKITVGEDLPILKRRLDKSTDNTSDTIARDFEYRAVGLITTITPSINNREEVTIKIIQEISSISRYADPPDNTAPVITNRQLNTIVKVKNRETVILGGLFQEKDNLTSSRIPILGDLPLIGVAFQSQSKSREKTELLVFITPRVVETSDRASQMMGLRPSAEMTQPVREQTKWEQKPRKWKYQRRE